MSQVVVSNETLFGLKAGLLLMSMEYKSLLQKIEEFLQWFQYRYSIQVVPFDVFHVRRIINDLTRELNKLKVMCERYKDCSDEVSVTVSLSLFRKPSPCHVFLPPHLRPLSRYEISKALDKFKWAVYQQGQNPNFNMFEIQ